MIRLLNDLRWRLARWYVTDHSPPGWAGAEYLDGNEWVVSPHLFRRSAEAEASGHVALRVVRASEWEGPTP